MLVKGEITLKTLPIAEFFGAKLDLQFLKSSILTSAKRLLVDAKKLVSKMTGGFQALIESFRRGTFRQIFSRWARESPLAAGAGVLAAGLVGGAVLIVGGSILGTVSGSILAVAKGLAGTTVGKIFLGAIGGGLVGGVGTTLINFSQFIWNFNWNQSDSEIEAEIKSAIESLYTPAGEVLGRGLATLLVGGKWEASRVEINVRQASLQYVLNEDIRDEMISSMSALIHASLNAFKILVVKKAYMQGRRGIKKLWANLPADIRDKLPGNLNDAITAWGEEDSKSFSLASEYEERVVDNIDDAKLKNALEGFTSGFWQQFSQGVIYKYG